MSRSRLLDCATFFWALSMGMVPQAPSMAMVPQAPAIAQAADEGDIMVTARRRTETLQQVPMALTALTSDALDRQQIFNTEDLNLAIPGLTISRLFGGSNIAQIFVRGIGQDDSQAASEVPVGIYIDGVPYTKATGALIDMIEFERVEVLRGPQGTLYGRNSMGGAIKYETRRPSLTEARFVGDVTVGSFNRIDVRGSVSAPVTRTVALKLDIISRNDDGFTRDALAAPGNKRNPRLNRTSRQGARLAALISANDKLEIYASADLTFERPGPISAVPHISGARADNLDAAGQISRSAPLYSLRLAAPELTEPNSFDGYGGQINATLDLDAVRITSIMGYRGFKMQQGVDTDGGPAVNGLVNQNGVIINRAVTSNYVRAWNNDTYTWELQAASQGDGPLTWLVGAFVMHEKTFSDDLFGTFSTTSTAPRASRLVLDQTVDSLAAFGEMSWRPVERLELSAGGRITRDKKDVGRVHAAALGLPTFTGTAYVAQTDASWSKFTPRLIARYEPLDDVSLYASWSRGFQAGAFQSFPFAGAASANTSFAPSSVDSLEAGVRTQLLDRKLTLNLTGFRAKYTDLPSTVTAAGGSFTVFTNDVEVRGLEFEASAQPFAGLSLFANGAFMDDRYNRSVVGPSQAPGANGLNRLKYLPHVTARGGFNYETALGGGNGFLGAVLSHSGDFFMSTVNTPFAYQRAFTLLDARMGYATPDGRWQLELSGRNLTDTVYAPRGSTGGGGSIIYGAPRTFALTLRTTL